MLFAETTHFVSINILLNRYYNSLLYQDSCLFHGFISLSDITDTAFCYLICVEYNHMLIVYAYMIMSVMLSQYTSIDYIKSINSNISTDLVKPALLILSIYILFDMEIISILVLEVNVVNLDAFSLYYWSGFQLSRKRNDYYNNNIDYICNSNTSSTAYILVNTKGSSKNICRRYFL